MNNDIRITNDTINANSTNNNNSNSRDYDETKVIEGASLYKKMKNRNKNRIKKKKWIDLVNVFHQTYNLSYKDALKQNLN